MERVCLKRCICPKSAIQKWIFGPKKKNEQPFLIKNPTHFWKSLLLLNIPNLLKGNFNYKLPQNRINIACVYRPCPDFFMLLFWLLCFFDPLNLPLLVLNWDLSWSINPRLCVSIFFPCIMAQEGRLILKMKITSTADIIWKVFFSFIIFLN